ncbi:hypothetical protein [Xanthomonas albilineans]|uniref:Transmembrane protein n=1 Tax=Xanthomonas albilineans (strain GPE PC73 / CFBP 7063) TaxID=380358 RepID=D2UBT9_XANAP|nr:hypothetical protein [Xanthomonas albilineans]QHQ27208.1 hypothetical protein XaFJ1_GM000446 [Xanthomonas albilineans]CBA15004.1 hypothetical protein XALC_0470 [Xanthomonas albilineans GPE PC73]
MTSDPTRSAAFDARMRALHQAGLRALPASTLARLRAARQQAGHLDQAKRSHARRLGWLLAAAPALLGVVLGMQQLLQPRSAPETASATAANATTSTTFAAVTTDAEETTPPGMLDENPDLYLWLGSDTALAME